MSTPALALLLMLADSIPAHTRRAPVVIRKVEPEYTAEERAAGLKGEVWMTALVDESGVPTEITVKRSTDVKLNPRAVAALEKWRFKPGLKDGEPATTEVTVAITFHTIAGR